MLYTCKARDTKYVPCFPRDRDVRVFCQYRLARRFSFCFGACLVGVQVHGYVPAATARSGGGVDAAIPPSFRFDVAMAESGIYRWKLLCSSMYTLHHSRCTNMETAVCQDRGNPIFVHVHPLFFLIYIFRPCYAYTFFVVLARSRQVLTLVAGWACFFYLLSSMEDDAEIKGFDPFAILGVTPSTEARDIKKQYRALSLIYHPDKVSQKTLTRLGAGRKLCRVSYRKFRYIEIPNLVISKYRTSVYRNTEFRYIEIPNFDPSMPWHILVAQ